MLNADAFASALPTALLVSGDVGRAWDGIQHTVMTGESAFESIFGKDFFAHLEENVAMQDVFMRSQVEGMAAEIDALLGKVDFSRYGTTVDVGGGEGALLAAILRANPQNRGILVDLDSAVPAAAGRFAREGLADRCHTWPGNFFQGVPGGGDLYLLRHVLHDWPDEDCAALLRTCARDMPDGAVLGIIELVIPDDFGGSIENRMTGLMDLYMMSLFGGGRERSAGEFHTLLKKSGFVATSITRLHNSATFILAERAN